MLSEFEQIEHAFGAEKAADMRKALDFLLRHQFVFAGDRGTAIAYNTIMDGRFRNVVDEFFDSCGYRVYRDPEAQWAGIVAVDEDVPLPGLRLDEMIVILVLAAHWQDEVNVGAVEDRATVVTTLNTLYDRYRDLVQANGRTAIPTSRFLDILKEAAQRRLVQISDYDSDERDYEIVIRPMIKLISGGDVLTRIEQSFSYEITGDTKLLKALEGPVVSLLRKVLDLPAEATPREALRTLGLGRFARALLIAGPVNIAGMDFSRTPLRDIGLPPEEVHCLRFQTTPAHLLTIENFASFNRHVIEADRERLGATIYVGGYPALATKEAPRHLAEITPADIPFYHWSDIDADGTWIFRTIECAIGRPLRPHLMSADLAETRGTETAKKKKRRLGSCPASSAIAALVEYLRREGAKTLEQEVLTPCRPDLTPNQ